MLEDACRYSVRQLQSPAARIPINTWNLARPQPLQKGLQCGRQRLARLGGQLFIGELRRGPRFANSYPQNIPAPIIERNVLVVLKEAHLSNTLGGDPAGRHMCPGPRGKLDSRVR